MLCILHGSMGIFALLFESIIASSEKCTPQSGYGGKVGYSFDNSENLHKSNRNEIYDI